MRTSRWKLTPNPWNPARTLTSAEVSDDPHGALALLLNRVAAEPETRSALGPDGPGLPFDGVIGTARVQSDDDIWSFSTWDEENPPPDWRGEELWLIWRDNPSAGQLISGAELRALVAEALASLPGNTPQRCTLLLVGELPSAELLAALSELDRFGGDQILAVHHHDSLLNHTPRGHASLPGPIDSGLARALSARLDGFALAEVPGVERAVFFCGALIERRTTAAPTLPALLDALLGPPVEGPTLRIDEAPLRAPPPDDADAEMPVCRVILAGVTPAAFVRAGLSRPGWRWRPQTSWATAMPWIELDGAEPLPAATLDAWSKALGCPAMSVWIPGEGAPFLWTELGPGQALEQGRDQGVEPLIARLHRVARHCEEEPGALFGRGIAGWR